MEYHLSSAHCQRTTSSKRKIDQDHQLMKSPPSDTSNSNSSSEPKVQLSHISSPEVTELRPPNQKVGILYLKQRNKSKPAQPKSNIFIYIFRDQG